MKALSVVGTAAMFLVGGGILAHGTPPIEHLLHGLGGVARTAADGVVGVVAGALTVGVVHLAQALRGRRADPAAAA
jgi:predicted DNA repair protein MutK